MQREAKASKTVAIIANQAFTLVNFRGPLIAELVRRGHRVLCFAPDYDADSRINIRSLNAEPIDYCMSRTGINPLYDLRTTWQLWRLLRRHRPDVSFAYFVKPVIYGTLAARLAGVRRRYAMIEGMGFTFTSGEDRGWRRRVLRWAVIWLLRVSLHFADRLLLLNSDDRREFIARRLAPKEKVALLGGIGVDLKEWAYREPTLAPLTFIFVGRLLRDKGVEEFVAAARLLREQGSDARFVMLGGIDVNPTAISLSQIEQWVVEGLIEWSGHVPVQPLLRQASVFVLPSYYREGVPRSTQEAMALGLPVITTDQPGCRETVIDGRNGILIPARDVTALARAMTHFVRRPDLIVPMGLESRRIAEDLFDVHKQNEKLTKLMGL